METQCTLHIAHCTLHIAHCTLHIAHCTLHIAHCTLHIAHCTLHIAHCTLHIAHCTLHIAHCTLHIAHCTLHIAHCTLHIAHCTLHIAHCTLHIFTRSHHCVLPFTKLPGDSGFSSTKKRGSFKYYKKKGGDWENDLRCLFCYCPPPKKEGEKNQSKIKVCKEAAILERKRVLNSNTVAQQTSGGVKKTL